MSLINAADQCSLGARAVDRVYAGAAHVWPRYVISQSLVDDWAAYTKTSELVADAGAIGGRAFAFWSGWTGYVALSEAARPPARLLLPVGVTLHITARMRFIGDVASAPIGIYNETQAVDVFNTELFNALTHQWRVIDVETVVSDWLATDRVVLHLGSNSTNNTDGQHAGNDPWFKPGEVLVDWIRFDVL